MKSETMLPLGKVDPGLREPDTPLDVRTIADGAEQIESLGYDGIAVEECKDLSLIHISEHTRPY